MAELDALPLIFYNISFNCLLVFYGSGSEAGPLTNYPLPTERLLFLFLHGEVEDKDSEANEEKSEDEVKG